MKKITLTSVIEFLKNIELMDWIIIIGASFWVFISIISKGSFETRIGGIFGVIIILGRLIKNRKYRLILGLFSLAIFFSLLYCHVRGWI